MKRAGLYGRDYDRQETLASQGNACAICGRTDCHWGKGFNDVWHTDHSHDKPGTHRGVLCASCNTSLGKLEPFMDKVIAYLAKWRNAEHKSPVHVPVSLTICIVCGKHPLECQCADGYI